MNHEFFDHGFVLLIMLMQLIAGAI